MTGGLGPRRKGATYERDVVAWLRANGLPYVERRIMGMCDDRGDITGWPGVCIECKSHKEINLAGWLDQLGAESIQCGAQVAALIVKRRRVADVGKHYVVMEAQKWLELMKSAGWVA